MASTPTFVPVPVPVDVPVLWKTRQVSSSDSVPLVIDEEFFKIEGLHKYNELVHHYSYLLERENTMDTIILNKYIHRRCTCCTRYTCGVCLTIIFYHKDDILLPYCHRCESFMQLVNQ